jgi:glycosyltransferase involved in cell wall biosynthesis
MLINWFGSFSQGNGYSGASEKIATEIEKLGYDVRHVGFGKDNHKNRTKAGKLLTSKKFKLADVGLCFGFPNAFSSLIRNKYKIGWTMFETDKLPTGSNTWCGPTGKASDMINAFTDVLIVPSQHNYTLFKNSGVTKPIKVIHLGIDTNSYIKMERPKRDTFTFLMAGVLTIRKNPGAVLSAFLDLFKDNENVRLVLKTNSGTLGHFQMPYKNVKIIDRFATPDEMLGYYRDADAFVFPSKGEGFGLTPLEAMATALPTIFANNTGMSEYANSDYNYPVPCPKMSKAIRFPVKWGDVGNWYEVDYEKLREAMKEVYENRDKWYKKGLKAADWVRQEWSYTQTAKNLLTVVNTLVKMK